MYLNEQIASGVTSFREAFYFLLDNKGTILRYYGDFITSGLLDSSEQISELLPETVLKRFYQFVKSAEKRFQCNMLVCSANEVYAVKCSFTKNAQGNVDLKGLVDESYKSEGLIPIDKLPLPIAMVKKDGEIIQLNRLFIDYFLESKIIAKPLFIQDIIKTNILSPETFDYRKMIKSDANSRAIFCHFKGAENNQTFLLNLIPVDSSTERIFLASIKDLTQFIEVQQNLEDQNQELRQQVQDEFELNRSFELKLLRKNRLESLGEIASGIFHELNQPLTHLSLKIDNMLENWQRGNVTEEYLMNKGEQIQRQIQRMRGIIDEMKQFSTIPESRDEVINIKTVLNCALEDVSYMQVSGLILVVNHVDDINVHGSASELEQVFVNILTNSIQSLQMKQSENGGFKPKLKVTLKKTPELITVVFIDNGLGVSDTEMEQLFKPFYTTKKEVGGTGLGLFIINNLMRKMNGRVTVDSKEGKFFKTTLSFPIIKEE
ncbi:HAMP domain-containing histidine kinase [Carboxylicivirga sediminis]|uniref:histidine kinase n=1 Tax=Carboxylicivirga sediminis TaxID=2006564 RepID=A0A941F5L9_9BACT|nr:HAMP domain-containing sensor histidine kinase [Carboxylicivirga sediminis]MBR8535670.1 HAMP domain-containing histidine kinase [Carboxylicivirga sediminis]